MAIDAVVGGIERPVLEPFDRDVAGAEARVLDLMEGVHPVDALALLRPEAVRVLDRARIHLLIFRVVDEGALLPLRRNAVDLVGHRPGSLLTHSARRLAPCALLFLITTIMRRRFGERQGRRRHTLV